MDFGLTEDQILFTDSLKRFLDAECPTTRVRTIMESDDGHDLVLWRQLAEMGLTGLVIPEAHGGAGLELLDAALAAVELGRTTTPGPFLAAQMSAIALTESGHTDAQATWLPGLASGEQLVTLAISEDIGTWDPDALHSEVRGGCLDGEKSLVPYADRADAILVAARDDDGPGCFLVERDAPGMTITPLKGTDMTRRVAQVVFAGTPATRIASGRGVLDRARDAGLVLLAADAYGGARRCLDMTVDYALTREQFGQVIGAFQGVKHQLADLATDLEPALSLVWYTAHAFDHLQDRVERHAALAKPLLTDLYDRAVRVAIELHGGIGFTWEFDLHLWFRRAIFDRAYLGGARLHRLRAANLAGW